MQSIKVSTLVLLGALLLAGNGAVQASGSPAAPTTQAKAQGSKVPTSAARPYTMQGTVKNHAGQPIAGAEVWADNTLYYNMNALATTDAQGHYTVALPHDQLGTWRAGGRFKVQYNGAWYDLGLAVNDEAAFSAETGAVRNFTLQISGSRPGGSYGGIVWPYFSSRGGDFDIQRVEYTFTPIGPLIDGSAAQPLKVVPTSQPLTDVPIGKYRVTARYVPKDGPAQAMLLQGRDENTWSSSTIITFRNDPQYGPFADFTVSLVPQP